MTTARCLLASLGPGLLLALACTSSAQQLDAGSAAQDGPASAGSGGAGVGGSGATGGSGGSSDAMPASGGQGGGGTGGTGAAGSGGSGGTDAGATGGVGGMCPPCVAPPFPGCVGSGPCGCGPYTCPDGGTDPAPAPGIYQARNISGGLDRLALTKRDPARDVCFRIILVDAPTYPSILPLDVPPPWKVERATVHRGVPSCHDQAPPSQGIAATAGSGRITWMPTLGSPCRLDVDVTMSFPPQPGIPTTELLVVRDLRPPGCN